MRQDRTRARAIAVFSAAAIVLFASACAEQRRPTPAPMRPDVAAGLGLGEDAIDPSQRDEAAGYNRWKPKPEPDGTASPLSPTRRRIARPSALE